MRWNTSSLMDEAPATPGAGSTLTQQEVDRVRAALAAPPVRQQTVAAPAPAPAAVPTKKELETAFWQDPLGMSAAIATQAANAARASGGGMDTNIENARRMCREEDPEVFDRYEAEVRQQLTAVDGQFWQNVTVWRNAFNLVRGQHSKEIFEMRRGAVPAVRSGSDGPAQPGVAAPPAAAKTKLTDEQQHVARKLGLNEDQYRFGSKIIEEQHGKEASPWDSVITTNGRTPVNGKKAA